MPISIITSICSQLLIYIKRTVDVESFLLHLISSFLIEVKLPARYTKSNNIEASSNEAVEGIVLEAFGHISDKVVPAVIVLLQRQIFNESWSLTVEEEAHHHQLHQPPYTDQQQAQGKLVATEGHCHHTLQSTLQSASKSEYRSSLWFLFSVLTLIFWFFKNYLISFALNLISSFFLFFFCSYVWENMYNYRKIITSSGRLYLYIGFS